MVSRKLGRLLGSTLMLLALAAGAAAGVAGAGASAAGDEKSLEFEWA